MTVGVAISTHRRPKVLAESLRHWAKFMPDVLVVNHDVKGKGVAATKNTGIAALMDAGCKHLFLCDDDVWPVSPDWPVEYIKDAEPHLMHCWGKSRLVSDDGHYTVWNWPRGVMLYVERRVVERVGGMRVEFQNAGEHAEWSRRIHACGYTRHPFADLSAARHGVWHALDYTRTTPSSLPKSRYSPEARAERHALYEKYRGTTDFVEYREK